MFDDSIRATPFFMSSLSIGPHENFFGHFLFGAFSLFDYLLVASS